MLRFGLSDKEREYIEKGVLGIRYFIDYIRYDKKNYLQVVRNCSSETKLWLLFILFFNNHDIYFDGVENTLLEKIYEGQTIHRSNSVFSYENGQVFDYGRGIVSNCPIKNYKENFKMIRNHIAHGNYFIDDEGFIEILEGDRRYLIDPVWLDALVMCCLSNGENCFYNGLYCVRLFILDPDFNDMSLDAIIDSQKYIIVKFTICTGSKERFIRKFGEDGDHIYLASLFEYYSDSFKEIISKEKSNNSQEKLRILKNFTLKFMKEFHDGIQVELVRLEKKHIFPEIERVDFNRLDNKRKLAVLANVYGMKTDVNQCNTLSFKYIYDMLSIIENIPFSSFDDDDFMNNFKFSEDTFIVFPIICNYLIKGYANILFSNLIENSCDYSKINKIILKRYKPLMEIHFGKSSVILKDQLGELKKSLSDLEKYHGSFCDIENCRNKIQELENSEDSYNILSKFRNAIVHNQLEFDREYISFVGYEKRCKYKRYNERKKEWYYKEVSKNRINFECRMRIDDFIDMLDEIYHSFGITTKVNITKYKKKIKNMG